MSVVKISSVKGNLVVVPCTTIDLNQSLAPQVIEGASEENITTSVDAEVDELE